MNINGNVINNLNDDFYNMQMNDYNNDMGEMQQNEEGQNAFIGKLKNI